MKKQLQILGLIPARGGSKGVPKKNIRQLAGKPLISWTIKAALESRQLERCLVSTDDEEIAAIACAAGAEVPFLRPAELATDDAPTWRTLLHAVEWLEAWEGWTPDAIVVLQPTSPLRRARHIDEALAQFFASGADTLISLTLSEFNPYWMMSLDNEGRATWFMGNNPYSRRQDLPPVYRQNGAIEITRPCVLRTYSSTRGNDICGYLMPACDALEIDTELDFRITEFNMHSKENTHA